MNFFEKTVNTMRERGGASLHLGEGEKVSTPIQAGTTSHTKSVKPIDMTQAPVTSSLKFRSLSLVQLR